MSKGQDWVFTQLGPPGKVLTLSGWGAPHGRERHEAVVNEVLVIRQKTNYYPGTDARPTRHVFGDKYEPWELKGRWMDADGGLGYANKLTNYARDFVRDKQPVSITWGDITQAEGFIEKLETGRESSRAVAWKLAILIDVDTSAGPPLKQPSTLQPKVFLDILLRAKPLVPPRTLPPIFKGSILDALDSLISAFISAIANVTQAVNAIETFEKAILSDINRLRGALHQVKTAALNLRSIIASLSQGVAMLNSRSAQNELKFNAYFTKTDVDVTRALGAAAELDRHAAIAERGKVFTTHRVRAGETYESIAAHLLRDPGKAQPLRDLNGARFGEEPSAGSLIKLPSI